MKPLTTKGEAVRTAPPPKKRRVKFMMQGGVTLSIITTETNNYIDQECDRTRAKFGNVRVRMEHVLFYTIEEDNGDIGFGSDKEPWTYGEDEVH
jgi:hypothetical protein